MDRLSIAEAGSRIRTGLIPAGPAMRFLRGDLLRAEATHLERADAAWGAKVLAEPGR
jgi:hypothetical protein